MICAPRRFFAELHSRYEWYVLGDRYQGFRPVGFKDHILRKVVV